MLPTEEYIMEEYSCKEKIPLLLSIINSYCSSTYLNKNLWMLMQISELLLSIETNTRKSQEIKESMCKLVLQIGKNKKHTFTVPYENIQYMLYSFNTYNTHCEFMREYVEESLFGYFCILYNNIKDSLDSKHSLVIANYIIQNNTNKELDGYDALFIFLQKIVDILHLDKKIKKYIVNSKDIFYYRLKKKDKPLRINLIYFSLYVMITRDVIYKPLSIKNTDYLFIAPKIDPIASLEMLRLREVCQNKAKTKEIVIKTDDFHSNIEVKKIYIYI